MLPVHCAAAPVLELQVLRSGSNRSSSNGMELIGFVSIPLFPLVVHERHLVSLALPITPIDWPSSARDGAAKAGTLEVDVQFLNRLSRDAVPRERIELVLHQLRRLGDSINDSTSALVASTAYLQVQRRTPTLDHRSESVLLFETSIKLPTRGHDVIEVDDVADLTTAVAGVNGHEGAVLALELCDGARQTLGAAHVPLRRGWRARLLDGRRVWWSLFRCTTEPASTSAATDAIAQVQVSFRVSRSTDALVETQGDVIGNIVVSVREAVLTLHQDSTTAPMSGTIAAVQLWLAQDDNEDSPSSLTSTRSSNNTHAKPRRTRAAPFDASAKRWSWRDETLVLQLTADSPCDRIRFELASDALASALIGSLDVASLCERRARSVGRDEWIALTTSASSSEVEALLLVQTTFVPALAGALQLQFVSARSVTTMDVPVAKTFFKCTWQQRSFTTAPVENHHALDATTLGASTLKVSIDSSTCNTTPVLLVQRMGVAPSNHEICLGECSIELFALLDVASASSSAIESALWYALSDRHDKTKTTGFVQIAVAFRAQRQSRRLVEPTREHERVASEPERLRVKALPAAHKVAVSETLVVWKKLFYRLDTNGNGCIDRSEFARLIWQHVDGTFERCASCAA